MKSKASKSILSKEPPSKKEGSHKPNKSTDKTINESPVFKDNKTGKVKKHISGYRK